MPALRAAALRRRHVWRLRCGRALGTRARKRRRAARFRARREAPRRPRPRHAIRRAGDEKRGGLRPLAARRRVARYARPDRRGVAQGPAPRATGSHAAPRDGRGRRTGRNEPLGRAAAADLGNPLARRASGGAALGIRSGAAGGEGQARWQRSDGWLALDPRANASVLRRRRAALAPLGAFDDAGGWLAEPDRMGRGAALGPRRGSRGGAGKGGTRRGAIGAVFLRGQGTGRPWAPRA